MMIKQPALAPSPQPRPAPTVRALPAELAAQRGPFWMPIRGPNPTPIDTQQTESPFGANLNAFIDSIDPKQTFVTNFARQTVHRPIVTRMLSGTQARQRLFGGRDSAF